MSSPVVATAPSCGISENCGARRAVQGKPRGDVSLAHTVLDILDRDLIATKKGMNLQGAWGIVQHIQGRFADGPAAVNPMLLEAEVKHAQARSGQELADGDAEPGEEDVEAVESGAEEEDASPASSSVPEAADAKPHHEQRAHTPKVNIDPRGIPLDMTVSALTKARGAESLR